MILVQLARAGDVVNVLPLAYCLSKKIGRVNFLVGKEHASILEGASYVYPMIWDGNQDSLPQALRKYQSQHVICTQAWLNPDQRRLTSSFSLEQWRYAGLLEERNRWPLYFDNRDPQREDALVAKHIKRKGRPIVLVATTSISTPYKHANKLIATIRGLDVDVIDMDDVKAERIYDLIALYDAADLMVSVDTVHCHLARASQCPLVMLVNDGWSGAVPPPQAVASWRYADLGNDVDIVAARVQKELERKAESIAVVINTFKPDTDRHKRAMATHPSDAIYAKFDHRPKVSELLAKGLEAGKDVVCFTNDDVAFSEGSLGKIIEHARKWDFGCSRRPRDPVHCGREVFWFKTDWLKKNFDSLPDAYWTVQKPDLIFAKWMRKMRGIETTLPNLDYDFAPVELPAGIVTHTEHESAWANASVENSMEGLHNERVWAEMK